MGIDYKRKNKEQRWSEASMDLALDNVRNNKLSVKKAARIYGLPPQTIHRRLEEFVDVGFDSLRRGNETHGEEIRSYDVKLQKRISSSSGKPIYHSAWRVKRGLKSMSELRVSRLFWDNDCFVEFMWDYPKYPRAGKRPVDYEFPDFKILVVARTR